MSEFLHLLKKRLQAQKMGLRRSSAQNSANPKNSFGGLLDGLKSLRLPNPDKLNQLSFLGSYSAFKPGAVATYIAYLFMIATAGCITFWVLKIAQIPEVPSAPASVIAKGMTLYSNQDGTSAYGLFGSKPLVTDNIFLRGVVITFRNNDGKLDGFAIFEIEGTPTNAISVGENIGKGLTLHSIGDESAILLYEGQKLEFKLSKSGDKRVNPSKK